MPNYEVKDFGNGLKMIFLGPHTDTGPSYYDIKKLREVEFQNVIDEDLTFWVDHNKNLYFGVGNKS